MKRTLALLCVVLFFGSACALFEKADYGGLDAVEADADLAEVRYYMLSDI